MSDVLETMEKRSKALLALAECQSGVFTDAPIPLSDARTPDIPASLLPGALGEFARALAAETETPEGMSVMTCLGVVAAAASKKFLVCPREGWKEPLNIYTVTGLPPANTKSLVLNRCTAPLVDWEQFQKALVQPEIDRINSERETVKRKINKMRDAAAGAAAKGKDSRELDEKISHMEANLAIAPILPCIFANDAGTEMLSQNIHEQGGRFAVFSDEGGIIKTVSGLYSSGEANVDIMLKGIDGGHVRVRRRNGEHSYDLNPYLTIALVVQPTVIKRMGENKAFSGTGFLERFLYVLPHTNLGYRTHKGPPVTKACSDSYASLIRGLIDIPMPAEDATHILTPSVGALKQWREFQQAIEVQLRPGAQLEKCAGWGGKICGFALRLAGLIHLIDRGPSNPVISIDSMNRALKLAYLLTEHALAAFSLMGTEDASEDAKEVAAWIVKNGKKDFRRGELTHVMRHRKCGNAKRLDAALDVLIDRHYVWAAPKARGSKTLWYLVNPALLDGATRHSEQPTTQVH